MSAARTPPSSGSLLEAPDPDYVAGTLRWCNDIRAEQGQPLLDRLPKGIREDPLSCPCGRATGLYVDLETYGPTAERRYENPLPACVIAFVDAFDSARLPAYDETPPLEEDWEEG